MNRWITRPLVLLAIALACAFACNAWGSTIQYTVTDLGTLGGLSSQAFGINGIGQVVGAADTGSGDHPFLYSNGTMTDLGTLGGGGGVAYAINGSGQVVGSAYTAGDAAEHAFLYGNGVMQDLGTLWG